MTSCGKLKNLLPSADGSLPQGGFPLERFPTRVHPSDPVESAERSIRWVMTEPPFSSQLFQRSTFCPKQMDA